MTAEQILLAACLTVSLLAALALWLLRDGSRLSTWLDGEIADATTLPAPTGRLDVKA